MNKNEIDTHYTPSAKLASIKDKGKTPFRDHENPTLGICSPRVRKLPNLAPKPAVINSETLHLFGGDSQRRRTRVSDNTQGSPQVLEQIYTTMEPMPLVNDVGPHMRNNILGLSRPVGGSNTQSMTNDTQGSENHAPATPFDPLPNSHNLSQGETSWPITLANTPNRYVYIPQAPSMMPRDPPISDLPGALQSLRICAGCDSRLMAMRQIIFMEVQDPVVQMRLFETYFALRDNWHSCRAQWFWGLEVFLYFDWVMVSCSIKVGTRLRTEWVGCMDVWGDWDWEWEWMTNWYYCQVVSTRLGLKGKMGSSILAEWWIRWVGTGIVSWNRVHRLHG